MAILGAHLSVLCCLVSMVTAAIMTVRVEESTRVGQPLVRLALRSEYNSSTVEVNSCSILGAHQDVFSCKEGVLYLLKKLDYDVKKAYAVQLSYADAASGKEYNTSLLIIVYKRDQGPVIEHIWPIVIKEELPVGTYIGKSFFVASALGSDSYKYNLKGQDSKYLTVNTTGHILILEQIDRDIVNNSVLTLSVDIVVTDVDENVFTAPLNITVIDINDNAPEFKADTIELNFRENTQGALHTFVVHDRDMGDNAKVNLRILDGNSTFSVRNNTLFLTTPLDYETSKKYNHEHVLIILAVDSPVNEVRNTGRTTVIIKILPVNEFSPVWKEPMQGGSGSRATVRLPDDATLGSVVTRLLATDNDAGPDGNVTYSVTEVSTDKGISVSGIFAINSDKLVVDALATQQSSVVFYNVIVSASDGGHPKKSTLGVIRVNIQPESTNLHDPVWLAPPLNRDNRAVVTIERNTSPLTVIATIRAMDEDSGLDGKLEYAVSKTTSDDGVVSKYIFLLEPDSGTLRLLRNQAESTVNYFDLQVTVTDGGTPQRSITRTLRVNIKVKHSLRWLSPLVGPTGAKVTVSVAKSTQPWTVVASLNATHSASGGTGNTITYKLLSTKTDKGIKVSSPVFLVQTEGEVRTVTPLFRDAMSFYDLEVEATSSNSLKKIMGTLRIMLKPEVEKVPLTWVSDMSANVSEAAPRGTAVTMIVATSTGQPLSQPIAYSLLSAVSDEGQDASTIFYVESASGRVILDTVLDREALPGSTPHFTLQVQAMVRNIPDAKITGKLKLYITDENEFAPSFDKSFYKKVVTCDIGIGYNILEFSLNDEDATADFELRLENPSEYVNAVTNSGGFGALLLKNRPASPSSGNPQEHFINLIVSDGGVPEKTSKAYVLLTIPWCSEIITMPATSPEDTDTSDIATVPGVTSDDDVKKTSREKDVTWQTTKKEELDWSTSLMVENASQSRSTFMSMTSMSTPYILYQTVVDEPGAWVVRSLCIILFLGYIVLIALVIKKKILIPFRRVEPQQNQTENNNTNENPAAQDNQSQIVPQTNFQDEAPSDPMVLPPYGGSAYGQMSPLPPASIAAPLAPPPTRSGTTTPMPSLLTEPTNSTPPLCTASQGPPKYLPPIHLDQGPKPPEL